MSELAPLLKPPKPAVPSPEDARALVDAREKAVATAWVARGKALVAAWVHKEISTRVARGEGHFTMDMYHLQSSLQAQTCCLFDLHSINLEAEEVIWQAGFSVFSTKRWSTVGFDVNPPAKCGCIIL